MGANKKKVFISDDDMKWFKIIIEAVAKGFVELNNIKLVYNGIGKWNYVKFKYKDVNLREKLEEVNNVYNANNRHLP